MALKREKYTLSNDDIDKISGATINELRPYRISKENLIRTRFSLEEALLRMQENYGGSAVIEVSTGRRFKRHIVEVRMKAKAYNPLIFSDNEFDEWDQLLSYADYQPDYYYQGGVNVVRWSIPVRSHHPMISFVIALAAGLIFGSVGSLLLEDTGVLMQTLQVFEEVWIRLLNVLSGPIVFLLIVTTVLNMDSISRQGSSAGRLFRSVFGIGFSVAAFTIIASFFAFPFMNFAGFHHAVDDLIFLLLQLVPKDVVSPFAEANSPQLLLLAFALGSALIASGRRYENVAELVTEANSVGLMITGWMSDAAPFFVFILLSYEIIRGQTAIYTGMWKPLLVYMLVSVVIMMFFTLYVSRAVKVPPGLLVRKLKGPFFATITEGSSDNVYDETLKNCKYKLGIEDQYAESGMAIGLVLYMPLSVAGCLIFTVYAASMNDVPATVTWYIIASVSTVLMSIASPPVPGVAILTYVVLFAQLGIPKSALISAMIFDILTALLTTAGNQYILQLVMVRQSARMAMLDHEVLADSGRV